MQLHEYEILATLTVELRTATDEYNLLCDRNQRMLASIIAENKVILTEYKEEKARILDQLRRDLAALSGDELMFKRVEREFLDQVKSETSLAQQRLYITFDEVYNRNRAHKQSLKREADEINAKNAEADRFKARKARDVVELERKVSETSEKLTALSEEESILASAISETETKLREAASLKIELMKRQKELRRKEEYSQLLSEERTRAFSKCQELSQHIETAVQRLENTHSRNAELSFKTQKALDELTNETATLQARIMEEEWKLRTRRSNLERIKTAIHLAFDAIHDPRVFDQRVVAVKSLL